MKFKTRDYGMGSTEYHNITDVIECAHLFAYNKRDKMNVILTVLTALASNLPKEAQVALAQQLGYEAVEE